MITSYYVDLGFDCMKYLYSSYYDMDCGEQFVELIYGVRVSLSWVSGCKLGVL